jgi:D-alanyl-D-alanine dipeptidase
VQGKSNTTALAIHMYTPQALLVGDQQKIALTFQLNGSTPIQTFKLKISILDQSTTMEVVPTSKLRYQNSRNKQQTFSHFLEKTLTEFKNLDKLRADHGSATFTVDFELIPASEATYVKIHFDLLDMQDQLIQHSEVVWKKSETIMESTLQHESQTQLWEELLKKYPQETILKEQLNSFVAGTSPTIAAPIIKRIPIQECNQELVDISVIQTKNPHSRISMMPNPPNNQPFSGTDYNAGLLHSGKIRQGMFERLMRMVDQLDKLAEDFGYKPGHIDIKVFEGLRDLPTQAMIFNNKAVEIAQKNPTWSKEQVEKETEKWVSPVKNNTPVHSTGAAIDIRLWDKTTSSFLDMGPFGVFSPNPTAPSFSKGISSEQQLNRLFLLLAANRAGLVNYSYEFWHFSYGDRYAAYWLEKNSSQRKAIYGAVSNPS